MFKIGAKVKLVHHNQYPGLVGLRGEVTHLGIESSLSDRDEREGMAAAPSGVLPSRKATEAVYRVHSGARTLYDIPESWLERG